MKKILLLLLVSLFVCKIDAQTIFTDSTEYLSPYVFGANLEHCRSTINSGLSAQMLRNRKFAGKPSKNGGIAIQWFGIGEKVFYMLNDLNVYTKHTCHQYMPRINEIHSQVIENLIDGQQAGIGQREIYLSENKVFQLRTVTKVSNDVNLIYNKYRSPTGLVQ